MIRGGDTPKQETLIAFKMMGTIADKIPYNIGSIVRGELHLKTNGNLPYAADIDGYIIGHGGPPASVKDYYITELAKYGIAIRGVVEDEVTLEIGSKLSDWNSYSIYGN